MDTRYIEELRVFEQHRNYHAAARELFMAPSTLMSHISTLESELGIQLVCKRGASADLTNEGRLFLSLACPWLEQFSSIVAECHEAASRSLPLRVASYGTSDLEQMLWAAVGEFSRRYPPYQVDITSIPLFGQGLPALELADADVTGYSVFYTPPAPPLPGFGEGIVLVPLYSDTSVFVVSRGHRFFEMDEIDVTDLDGENTLLLNQPGFENLPHQYEAALKSVGADIRVGYCLQRMSSYFDFAYSNRTDCYRIINRQSIQRYGMDSNPAFRFFEVKGLPLRCDRYAMVDTRRLPQAILPLFDILGEHVHS